jgi:hypothetical protein
MPDTAPMPPTPDVIYPPKAAASHVFDQGACIWTLMSVGFGAMLPSSKAAMATPGPEITKTIPPRSAKLLADYVTWAGGDAAAYEGFVPPHLFPQWGFPPMAVALTSAPWPMTKILNQGCRLEVHGRLPADEPLVVRTHVSGIVEEEHKARITTRIVTGTESEPELITADVHAVVPLGKKKGGAKREAPIVPADATVLGRVSLPARAGLDFALLTGDFNPIHWISPYAKMAGFKNTILHGFASMAMCWEAIVAQRCGGDPTRLKSMDVRFVRPQLLPQEVALCIGEDGTVGLGVGPGGRATMLGTYETT